MRASTSCSTDFQPGDGRRHPGRRASRLGIRQRLSLAVAVLHEPEVLILDEPTSGVDPVARDGFWELLIRLSRENGRDHLSLHPLHERGRALRPHVDDARAAGCWPRDRRPSWSPSARPRRSRRPSSATWRMRPLPMRRRKSRPSSRRRPRRPRRQSRQRRHRDARPGRFSLSRVWAFARREAIELQPRHGAPRVRGSSARSC